MNAFVPTDETGANLRNENSSFKLADCALVFIEQIE